MFIVSNFLDIEVELAGDPLSRLETVDPRDFEAGINGALDITLPAAAPGNEIRLFCERLQNSAAVDIAGTEVDTVKDLYLDRSRAIRTFTPAGANIEVNLNLTGDQRAGTILAWLASEEIEITDEVIITYPLARNLSPRVSSERKEGGDALVSVIGPEPKLDITINLRAEDEGEEPDPDARIYRILRSLSPQGDFFFHGRNLSEAYIIGKSARRAVKHVYTAFGRENVQPVVMEVL